MWEREARRVRRGESFNENADDVLSSRCGRPFELVAVLANAAVAKRRADEKETEADGPTGSAEKNAEESRDGEPSVKA
jgi:hypothetical protein